MTRRPADVLVLHGPPGAGKSTMARAISELLRAADRPHAVIDLDDLNLVHPPQPRSFARDNLATLWPRYAAIPDLKLILPTVLADSAERRLLHEALPGARLLVCELTAPEGVLRQRIRDREPNAYWQAAVTAYIDLYLARTDLADLRDVLVSTHAVTVEDTAAEAVRLTGW